MADGLIVFISAGRLPVLLIGFLLFFFFLDPGAVIGKGIDHIRLLIAGFFFNLIEMSHVLFRHIARIVFVDKAVLMSLFKIREQDTDMNVRLFKNINQDLSSLLFERM